MKRGITLIETVVAVTVLIFALGGPFLLAAKSLRSAAYAREEIAAARLAEEGMEVIHNMRDNNSARSVGSWVNNIATTCNTTGCLVDISQQQAGAANTSMWKSTSLATCGSVAACVVYADPTGMYRQVAGAPPGGWVDTGMKRIVRVTTSKAAAEYAIEVEVDYPVGAQTRKIVLRDTLMNWFPVLPI